MLAPSLDSGSMRGLGRVTVSLVDALTDLGYEIVLVTGAPDNGWRSKLQKIDELVRARAINHYLSDGLRSKAFTITRTSAILAGLSYIKALLAPGLSRQVKRHEMSHAPEEIRAFRKIHSYVAITLFYQLAQRLPVFINSLMVLSVSQRLQCDIILCTSPIKVSKRYFWSSGSRPKLVQYVHDILPLTSLESPTDSVLRFTKEIRNTLIGSDRILVNSRYTAEQLKGIINDVQAHAVYVSAPQKTSVKHDYHGMITNRAHRAKSYILFMSALESRKNISRLLEAYSLVADSVEFDLIMVGSKGYGWDTIEETFNNLPERLKKRIHIKGYVSEAEKWTLISNALFFIHPAIDEGLGLPVMEALLSGTPVVATRLQPIEEFAPEESMVYIDDPYDSVEIADRILFATHNIQTLREQSRRQSSDVAYFFSSDKFQHRLSRALNNIEG